MRYQPVWNVISDGARWDSLLASSNGHPLQSALWGNARNKVDGMHQLLLECCTDIGELKGLARIEIRAPALIGKIAWLPKGPVLVGDDESDELMVSLCKELKRRGFIACITDPYCVAQLQRAHQPKTIWLDLTLGLDVLAKGLDSQWRYGAKRALREGVTVRKTLEPKEVSVFFQLCNSLSMNKGFSLPGSEALIQELIRSATPDAEVGMTLYVGDINGTIAGGALIARSGRHLHYFWGASDRRFSKYRVSEAIHWQIIQDGVSAGMTRYDLEGIDPLGNPGVYQFKRKMGGTEVVLHGTETVPLSWAGHVVVRVGRRLGRFN